MAVGQLFVCECDPTVGSDSRPTAIEMCTQIFDLTFLLMHKAKTDKNLQMYHQ